MHSQNNNYHVSYSYSQAYKIGSQHTILASCPWGPVTANGVDLLTEIYVSP